MWKDERKGYIGKHIVEVLEFVISVEDLVLDPYAIEMGLDQTYMKSTRCELKGDGTYQGRDCALDQ